MSRGRIILVGGGARSGKSAFALERARGLGERRTLIATAELHDDEMRARAARHRAEREGSFATLEEPYELSSAVRTLDADVVVLDCLTVWLANLLLRGDSEADILERVRELEDALRERVPSSILVTNEVGMGVVPEHALGRAFRDLTGRAHQRLAATADEVHVALLGLILRLKPAPIELQGSEAPS